MNPRTATMAELLKAAPKGTYMAAGFSVRKPDGFKIMQQRPAGAGAEAWEKIDHDYELQAELIARLLTWATLRGPDHFKAIVEFGASASEEYMAYKAPVHAAKFSLSILEGKAP